MRTLTLLGRTATLAATALAWACGTDAVKPTSLSIVSGDAQSGLAGTPLAQPLVVELLGSDQAAFAGATLNWQVTSGSGTVTPPASVTDANGHSTVAVSLGGPGALVINAAIDGVAPATFHLSAIAPCNWRQPFGFNSSITASLSTADCLFPDGSFIDYYALTAANQQAVRIRLVSSAFDAYLFFNDAGGVPVAGNDDDSTSTNSDIRIIVAPGSYAIGANSYDPAATGAYTLSTVTIPETISNCAFWFMAPAVSTSQQLTPTDCASGGFYADGVVVYLQGGRSYTITQSSTAFDTYLVLMNSAGAVVASDDNGAGGTNSRIVYTPPGGDAFIILAESFLAGATGGYTLAMSAPVAGGVAGPAERAVALSRKSRSSWRGLAMAGVARARRR